MHVRSCKPACKLTKHFCRSCRLTFLTAKSGPELGGAINPDTGVAIENTDRVKRSAKVIAAVRPAGQIPGNAHGNADSPELLVHEIPFSEEGSEVINDLDVTELLGSMDALDDLAPQFHRLAPLHPKKRLPNWVIADNLLVCRIRIQDFPEIDVVLSTAGNASEEQARRTNR